MDLSYKVVLQFVRHLLFACFFVVREFFVILQELCLE